MAFLANAILETATLVGARSQMTTQEVPTHKIGLLQRATVEAAAKELAAVHEASMELATCEITQFKCAHFEYAVGDFAAGEALLLVVTATQRLMSDHWSGRIMRCVHCCRRRCWLADKRAVVCLRRNNRSSFMLSTLCPVRLLSGSDGSSHLWCRSSGGHLQKYTSTRRSQHR